VARGAKSKIICVTLLSLLNIITKVQRIMELKIISDPISKMGDVVMQMRQSVRLAIKRLRVLLLARHCCEATLGKLLTICLLLPSSRIWYWLKVSK